MVYFVHFNKQKKNINICKQCFRSVESSSNLKKVRLENHKAALTVRF